MRSTWPTQRVPGQLGLHKETLSQTIKQSLELAVKSISYSARRRVQGLHGNSQLLVISVAGALQASGTHIVHRHTCRQNAHIQKKKAKSKLTFSCAGTSGSVPHPFLGSRTLSVSSITVKISGGAGDAHPSSQPWVGRGRWMKDS